MEGCQASVDVFSCAGSDGEGAGLVCLGSHVGIWIDCLPDGEDTIHIGVVEEKDWVKGAVGYKSHPSSYQAMNGIMNTFQRIVLVAPIVHIRMIRKGCVARLSGEEKVGSIVDTGSIGVEIRLCPTVSRGVRSILESFAGWEVWCAYGRMESIAK